MLQKIRDNITGWFATLFLGAIAIVFIFWGIQFESAPTTYAAKVNGEGVPLQAVREAWQRRQSELMQQSTADELPDALVASEQKSILSEFIRQELLMQRTEELGYRVSDRDLVEALNGIPALQVDGQFSRDRYAALLRQQGRTEAQFEDQFRRDLEAAQLRNGIAISSFVTPGEMKRRVEIEGERRDVEYLTVTADRFKDSVTIAPEAAAAYYNEHKDEFISDDEVTLQYLLLDLADVAAQVEVSEDALRQYYDEVAAERFVAPERRRASHILIESGSDDAAAREKAEKLLARAKAGEDFAKLAKEYSDDPGSKEQGGDLGWATRESFVPQFSEALFGMSEGEIRGPVKTQFGYHLIRLDGIEPARQRTFDEVRAEIEAEYRTEKAQSVFYEKSERLADEAFAALSELDSVAENLGMTLQTVPKFTRSSGGGPFGSDKKVIDAAFSAEVLNDAQNSPALSLGDDKVVVVRVAEHRPPAQRPFEAVQAEVQALLLRRTAEEAARSAAADALERLKNGESFDVVAESLDLQPTVLSGVGRNDRTVPPGLLAAMFATNAESRPAGIVALDNGDVALFSVGAVHAGSMPATQDDAEFSALTQQAAAMTALGEFDAYVRQLEGDAKITLNKSVFE
jgi:peptidyl-prolyl cis-trans isomerase D